MLIFIPSNCKEIVGSLKLTLAQKAIRQSTTHNPIIIIIIMWFHSKHKLKKSNPCMLVTRNAVNQKMNNQS